jgi:ABC-type polysaccharide/polyol phosphate transport system ATPase subunit
VSKRFRYATLPKQTTLKEAVVKRLLMRSPRRHTVSALSDVSFRVEHGQMLGVVGHNGSGKTTLLRILAGVYRPDSGQVELDGRITPLLSLGAGFHPDLTGRENARLELLILGLSPSEIDSRMEAIAAFSEIGDFLDAPVHAYSSGMMMRLAFAAAVSVDPDILLLDEVLAVGDEGFAQKCLATIDGFRARGKTIVLVTHASALVRERCDVALWLERGNVAAFGAPADVIDAYHAQIAVQQHV